MAPNASYLSSAAYGYDFVVATTQDSINAGLIQYLSTVKHSPTTLCFLADDEGQATRMITLPDLLELTEQINPFDIPHGTKWSQGNYKIDVLTRARFLCAIELNMGIPPGFVQNVPGRGPQIILPQPVIELRLGAGTALFNMYCSSLRVCLNAPPSGWGASGSWNIYSQKPGEAWYIQTAVDLTTDGLDRNLDVPFFNERPLWKAQVREQLNNLSGTAFSLQQLLVNLDTALMQTTPTFIGITNAKASNILIENFKNLWFKQAQTTGLPLIGLQAVPQILDKSPLQIKALERWNSPVVDPATLRAVKGPTKEQLAATTLNYLCSTATNTVPSPHAFTWNWVEPDAVSQSSGVIAINRNTLAKYFVGQLKSVASQQCLMFAPKCTIDLLGTAQYDMRYVGLGQPSAVYHPEGGCVASLSFVHPGESSAKASEAAHCSWNIRTQYACDIYFGVNPVLSPAVPAASGNIVVVSQTVSVHAYMSWNANSQGCNVIKKTIIDSYDITAGPDGKLVMTSGKPITLDASESPDTSNKVIPIGDGIERVKTFIKRFESPDIPAQALDQMGRFIFPGAMVFTYSNAAFSDHQDLTALITYKNPTAGQFTTASVTRAVKPKLPSQSTIMAIVEKINQARVASALPKLLHNVSTTNIQAKQDESLLVNDAKSHSKQSLMVACNSDLIQNYVQGELVGPQGDFEALQTSDGHSLLFATSTSGTLNVFEETSGQSQTGWTSYDISSQITKQFPTGSLIAQFAVGQSVMDEGSIGMAMAVRSNGTDLLYLSMRNSNKDTSWISSPKWTPVAYDGKQVRPRMEIAEIYFSETQQNMQYIIIDLVRDPKSKVRLIDRYIIDPAAPAGSRWMSRPLPFEVESGKYQSCTGRSSGSLADGVYTGGIVVNQSQLAYVPFFNLSPGNAPPMPTVLTIPSGFPASAITTARNGDQNSSSLYGTSDLYVASGEILYRWAADNQADSGTRGVAILTSSFITGTDRLLAVQQDKVITIFGRNANDEVYYTSCSISQVSDTNAWSLPLPIMTGIEKITAFVNKQDGSNTVFAAGGGKISRIVQSTGSAGKMWLAQDIHLASPPKQPSQPFKSYTTIIHVTGKNATSVGRTILQLSASMRVPVYIRGLYYVLSSIPIHVDTDDQGRLDLVQATNSLVSPLLTITVGDNSTTFDPAKKSWDKLVQIKTPEQLRSATLVESSVGGGVTATTRRKPLVSTTVSDADAKTVVDSIQGLAGSYRQLSPGSSVSATSHPLRSKSTIRSNVLSAKEIRGLSWDGFVRDVGDLFRSVEVGVGKFIQVIRDAANNVWHFICEIAGKVYNAVLDSTQAVLGALQWVFDKIKTGIMDVIHYLEFLFDWDDIRRSKDVMHNVIKLYMLKMVDDVKAFQGSVDNMFNSAQKTVATWAGRRDWSALGDVASSKVDENGSDAAAGQTPGSQLFMNHFKNHADNITVKGQEPSVDMLSSLMKGLLDAVKAEGKVLDATFERLKSLATDFHNLTLTAVLKRIAAIVTEAALGSTKVIVHALLQVLIKVGSGAVALLDCPVHVPVISDILNAIGVPDISFLDLLTWIGAVGYTVVYKIGNNKAPFNDDHTTNAILSSQNWPSLQQAMRSSPPTVATMSARDNVPTNHPARNIRPFAVESTEAPGINEPLFKAGHAISSFFQLFGNSIFFIDAIEPIDSPVSKPKAALAIIIALSSGAVDALAGHYPLQQSALVTLGRCTTAATVLSAILFAGAPEARKVAVSVNVILIVPAMICTGYHFHELSQQKASSQRSAAIIGECSTLMSFMSRVAYCATVQVDDPKARIVLALLMAAFNDGYAGLQLAETIVG